MQVVYSPRRVVVSPKRGAPAAETATTSRAAMAMGSPRSSAPPDDYDSFGGGLSPQGNRARLQPSRSAQAPQVADLRRPSIDVLMMPSGPSPLPTHVAAVELGDPLSPRSAAVSPGRLRPVGEASTLAPEPELSAGPPQRPNPKQDRWAGGIVEGQGVYTGWMLKKGETGNSWKRRYFACSLASKTLSYYDKPGGTLARRTAVPRAAAPMLGGDGAHACGVWCVVCVRSRWALHQVRSERHLTSQPAMTCSS